MRLHQLLHWYTTFHPEPCGIPVNHLECLVAHEVDAEN